MHLIILIQAWQYELNIMEEEFNAKRPDLGAIEEFKRKESVYLERVLELDEITKKKEDQRKRHDNLRYNKHNGKAVLVSNVGLTRPMHAIL